MCIVVVATGILSACTIGNVSTGSLKEYTGEKFNNEEAQFCIYGNIAATEDGYYYIANSPVYYDNEDDRKEYLYFFDIENNKSSVVCSKKECIHNDETCAAYVSPEMSLADNIWYHNQRIYMIESTGEKDLLVSYDRNFENKKVHNELSVDGKIVSAQDSVMYNGNIYYIVLEENYRSLYSISADKEQTPQLIKKYERYDLYDIVGLSSSKGKICITVAGANGTDSKQKIYICDVYDIETQTINEIYNSKNDKYNVKGDIDIMQRWKNDVYIIGDNMFFGTIDSDDFIVNKLNIDTGKCEQIYSINAGEHNNSVNYMQLSGCDGEYLYILEGIDYKKAENGDITGNNLYVIDEKGKNIDTLKLQTNEENVTVQFSKLLVDKRCIFSMPLTEIKGLQLNEQQQRQYDEVSADSGKNVSKSIVGLIDKNYIGKGNYSWTNITAD